MVVTKKEMKNAIATDVVSALDQFNQDYTEDWEMGSNWSSVGTQFETYVNKYLFPKLNATYIINIALGNRFDWLAEEIDFVGQYSEEYVILDTVPVSMNLSKSVELMLKRNYPRMATRLYSQGIVKKTKFTLNNNDARFNFATLADGISYAIAVYKKAVSDINVLEEKEIKGMLVDYALNQTQVVKTVTSPQDLFNEVNTAILNIQNNSEKYNECNKASGGALGRYTTVTDMKDVAILTTDKLKTYLLDTKLANTFQVAGLDLSRKIISFDDLGGVYRFTDDIQIKQQTTIDFFRSMGDYQIEIDDILPVGSVVTFDVTNVTELASKVEEIKPTSDLFAYVFDVNKIRYKRNTNGMLKEPFVNPEFDEVTHWLHYYSFKAMSPFFNNVVVKGE